MRDGRSERAALQARARDEAEPDPAGREVPLDDRDLREIALRVGDRAPVDTAARATSDSVTTWSAIRPIARALAAGPGDREVARRRAALMRTVCRTQSGISTRGHVLDRRPRFSTVVRREAHEVREDEQVGLSSPGAIAPCRAKPVPQRGMERRHQQSVLGRDPGGDRLPHHPVDVAVVRDVLRVAVVGAERDPARAELLRRAAGGAQVARHRRLADQEPHPGTQPLAALLDRQRLVVGA